MAGRPATVRGGGLTGLHYGLIAFVIISVASLGLFIFQLTKVKAVQDQNAALRHYREMYGTPPAEADDVGPYYEDEAIARDSTVFAVMAEDLAKMALLIAETEHAVGYTLEQRANQLREQIAADKPGVIGDADGLLEVIRKLDGRLTQEIGRHKDTSDELAEKSRAVQSLTEQLKSSRDQFEEEVASLKTQIEQAGEDFSQKLSEKETQLTELTSDLEVREQQLQLCRREGDQEKRELQLQIDRLERQIARLNQQIQDLRGSFDAEAILRKADGRILRAIPGSEVVYVNVGSNDNIKVGMGFEVYSQTGSAREVLRGKASLEVVTLMPDTAECRVTRSQAGRPIIEGDIVVNIAYEQGRLPKFVIRGQFDLNYDGQVDRDGPDQIASIIRQWGGQVVPELDESIDYVVIGVMPRALELPPNATDVVRDQAERNLLKRTEFQRLIEQARSMYIPVITQNQFLFLTGYAGDAITRRR